MIPMFVTFYFVVVMMLSPRLSRTAIMGHYVVSTILSLVVASTYLMENCVPGAIACGFTALLCIFFLHKIAETA